MDITFDPNKNDCNIEERGISFECAADFDFETALLSTDDRKNYGETRIRALGYIGDRLHWRPAACAGIHRNRDRHPCHQPAQSQQARGKLL
jgi:uncharacterized DUF497 family protein